MSVIIHYASRDLANPIDQVDYDFDHYVLRFGEYGYLKRMLVRDKKFVGSEYNEIRQFNFASINLIPGRMCAVQNIVGIKPYVTAFHEHPYVMELARNQLCYRVSVSSRWIHERIKDIPDLGLIYGDVRTGYLSGELIEIEPIIEE